jgi:PTH1 family peptidyl-tRNA hydrolase
MNLSGEAVKKACDKYSIPYSKAVAICDEYNFPAGKVHIKAGGSSGGHNGINSIIEMLGMQNFYRLRCGIGKNFPPGGMVDYVLSNFEEEEKPSLTEMIAKGCDALDYLVKIGPARAVSEINSEKLWRKDEEEKSEKPTP